MLSDKSRHGHRLSPVCTVVTLVTGIFERLGQAVVPSVKFVINKPRLDWLNSPKTREFGPSAGGGVNVG